MKVDIRKVNSFCSICGFPVTNAEVKSDISRITIRDIKFTYNRLYATCPVCKKEIYVASLNDENAKVREEAYSRAVKAKGNE